MQRLEEGREVKRGNSWKIQRDVVLIRPVRESDRNMPVLKKRGNCFQKLSSLKENVQYVQSSPLREKFSPKLLTL